MPEHDALEDYQATLSLPIQWGDMDAFNHVNNVVHIRWLESSRIEYLAAAGMHDLMMAHKLGPILAAVNCSYKRQLAYPGSITVGARVTKLGRTSLTVAHRIINDRTGEIAAEGESVIVIFDFQNQRPVRMPDDVKQAVLDYQGPLDL